LETLFQGWDKLKETEKHIEPSEVRNYIEGHPESLFIDRIEIYLKDITLPEDIILVDLPGLGVSNLQHVKITEDYIKGKAKVFVVCTAPKHLLEGQDIELLDAINRNDPAMLRRSFWVINQMDDLDPEQKKQTEANFQEKMKKHRFNNSPERVFKVSAQNYSLLKHICAGTLENTASLKKHIDQLDKIPRGIEAKNNKELSEKLLQENPEVAAFVAFKEALFTYLNETAKKDFLFNARGELSKLIAELTKILSPLYLQYQPGNDYEKVLFSGEVDKLLNPFIEQLNNKVEESVKNIRLKEKQDLWERSHETQLTDEIRNLISDNFEEIKNSLSKGTDVEANLSRLPAKIDARLTDRDCIRQAIATAVKSSFIDEFLTKLFGTLITVKQEYLPEDVINSLKDKLSERDITMRLYGLADSMLYQYVRKIDEIGLNIGQTVGTLTGDERIQKAIEIYETELVRFINEMGISLNENIWRTLKNHAEYIQQEVMNIIKNQRKAIHDQIANTVNLSEKIELEKQKMIVIKGEYTKLIQL